MVQEQGGEGIHMIRIKVSEEALAWPSVGKFTGSREVGSEK